MFLPQIFKIDDCQDCWILVFAPCLFYMIWFMIGRPVSTWDAFWYRNIVDQGYMFDGNITHKQNLAFLPGFPLLIQVVSVVFWINTLFSQKVVSLLGYLIGAWLFYKVFSARLGKPRAAHLIIVWSIMPFSLFYLAGYAESIMFAIVGAYFYLSQRGKRVLSALAISYGLITRPHVMALIPVLIYDLIRQEYDSSLSWKEAIIGGVLKGIELSPVVVLFPMFYTIYCCIQFDDPLIYRNSMYAWYSHATTLHKFAQLKIEMLTILTGNSKWSFPIGNTLTKPISPVHFFLLNLILGGLLSFWFLIKRYHDFFIYNLSVLVFWLFMSSVQNGGRHISMMFSIPFCLSYFTGLFMTNDLTNHDESSRQNYALYHLLGKTAAIGMLMLLGIHYIWYTICFFNQRWIS